MILYILKFEEIKAIKIGIATTTQRIYNLKKIYENIEANLEESYIVSTNNKSDIKLLEKQLLGDYCDHKYMDELINGLDGHTEFLNINILEKLIEDIEYKSERFPEKNIQIKKGIQICNNLKTLNLNPKIKTNKKVNLYPEETKVDVHSSYLTILSKYKNEIVEINYDKYQCLYLKISNIDIDEWSMLRSMPLPAYLSKLSYSKVSKELELHFINESWPNYSDSLVFGYIQEIYDFLNIDSLCLDKQYGIKKEKIRLNDLSMYFDILLKHKSNIYLEHLITKKIKFVNIDELISNLIKVINTGQGYYILDYVNTNKRKQIFYNDFKEMVKSNSSDSCAFEDIDALNSWLENNFKKEDLFKFRKKIDYYLFWYAICEYNIPLSYSYTEDGFYMEFNNIMRDDKITVEELKKTVANIENYSI